MSSLPLPSIPVSLNDQITHLYFVAQNPGVEAQDSMDTGSNQDLANSRYLVITNLDFGTC